MDSATVTIVPIASWHPHTDCGTPPCQRLMKSRLRIAEKQHDYTNTAH